MSIGDVLLCDIEDAYPAGKALAVESVLTAVQYYQNRFLAAEIQLMSLNTHYLVVCSSQEALKCVKPVKWTSR